MEIHVSIYCSHMLLCGPHQIHESDHDLWQNKYECHALGAMVQIDKKTVCNVPKNELSRGSWGCLLDL